MLLYRLAKWMEKRDRLSRMISDAQGDVSQYVQQKEQLEKQLLSRIAGEGEQTTAEQGILQFFAEQDDLSDGQVMAESFSEPVRPDSEKQWVR